MVAGIQTSLEEPFPPIKLIGHKSNRLTSLGIDNTGKLVLTYGKEDADYYVDGDPSSSYVYRAAESTFFCRLRDLFKPEMEAMFIDRESKNAWSATELIDQWDNAQNQFPEELWRIDIERKYLRTYLGTSIDNSIAGASETIFLPQMMNGRKKYQRRMFERNQELYMATKYFGKTAAQDQIRIRFNNPESYVVKPDFTLYLTPYSDMYIGVKFGNVEPVNFRAKAGVEYSVPYNIAADTADITLIYGASFIQAIGDLSKCYVGDNDFTKATRLQSLVIGSDIEGYSNSYMTEIKLANNKLLEYLDVRNVTGLASSIDLSQCGNMLELRAEGSGATGVIFANGGKIQKFYLPSITSLTAKNLNYIEDFDIESYINLQTLVVENTPAIDVYGIVDTTLEIQSSLPKDSPRLSVLRLVGLNWNIESTDILEDVILLRGQNSDGGEIPQSVLTGKIHVPTIREKQLEAYQDAWSDLEITYDNGGLIVQHPVTFVNYDGTPLTTLYVDDGGYVVDPVENGDIPTPTRESSISTDYTYAGWDRKDLVEYQIFGALTVTATYSEELREYTIRYIISESGRETELQRSSGKYGTNIPYTGEIPTYTLKEGVNGWMYYLFNRWDKSGFLLEGRDGTDFDDNGVKTVTAIFDSFKYTSSAFEGRKLKDLDPVEIYALTKLTEPVDKELSDYGMSIVAGDNYSFDMGYDIDYDDIDSNEIISAKTSFNGTSTSYLDTGIKLFDEDRDFVLAIDYKISSENTSAGTFMQCFQGSGSNGFKLGYDAGSLDFYWGASNKYKESGKETYSTFTPSPTNSREMLVIRHKKGDNNLYVYTSNLDSTEIKSCIIEKATTTHTDNENATLIFGAAKMDSGRTTNHCIGDVYWCKIWYQDLGEDICEKLVGWTHEKITLGVSGFYRYSLFDDPSKETMISLVATHLLDRTKKWNNTNSSSGGWASAALNEFLNSRFYNATPIQIKPLMKKMSVLSTKGEMSTELSESGCYVTIPSLYDVDTSQTAYKNEVYDSNRAISTMTTNDSRKRAFDGGNYNDYWLRSPNTGFSNYVWRVSKDGAVGSTEGITNPNNNLGVLIEISF